MDKEPLLNFIQNNIPNIAADRQSLIAIADQFEEKTIAKNDYLLKQGKVSGYF